MKFKRAIVFLLALAMVCGLAGTTSAYTNANFNDVPTSSWAYSDVMTLVDMGVIKGVGNGNFDPDGTLTVGDFLTLMGRLLYPEDCDETETPYYWLTQYYWYTYYENAYNRGIIQDGEYYAVELVTNPITRYEMATMLTRADVNVLGRPLVYSTSTTINDYASIPDVYQTSVNHAYSNGLLNGDEYGNFNGTNYLSRAEAAAVLNRLRVAAESTGAIGQEKELTEVMDMTNKQYPQVTIEMENGGKIVLELYPDKAPNTVYNFIALANKGFYNGLIFHRVIEDFMIQGGCPDGVGTGGPGYGIDGEFSKNRFDANDISHKRGVISMARAQNMNSAGSQFFICHADATFLDGDYAAFGKVISGMEIVDAIAVVDTNASDKPSTAQRMKSVTVDTFGVDYPAPTTNNNR